MVNYFPLHIRLAGNKTDLSHALIICPLHLPVKNDEAMTWSGGSLEDVPPRILRQMTEGRFSEKLNRKYRVNPESTTENVGMLMTYDHTEVVGGDCIISSIPHEVPEFAVSFIFSGPVAESQEKVFS